MSLLDQVRKLEQQVTDRLKELEPLTREYEQLRKFAERLGLKYSPRSADAEPETERATTARGGGTRARAKERSARTPAKAQATRSPGRTRAAKTQAKPRGARSTSGQRAAGSAQATGAERDGRAGAQAQGAGSGGQRSGGRRATAARPGQRHDDVLRLVAESPGITVREIGERLGVDATGLYRVVKRLADDGRVRKQGAGLHPVEPATVSAPAPGPEATGATQTTPESGPQPPEASAPAEPESPIATADTASAGDT